MTPARFPHSDTPGSTLGCQLPRAYRRLLRPSSALDAKASTMCPSQLVTHTTNPTPPTQHSATTQTNQAATTSRWDQTGDAHNTPQKNQHTPEQSPGMHHKNKNKKKHTLNPPQPAQPQRLDPPRAGRCISRCSRPLSRSQTTTPHHPAPHTGEPDGRAGGTEAPHASSA
jgi:hypothetical protein